MPCWNPLYTHSGLVPAASDLAVVIQGYASNLTAGIAPGQPGAERGGLPWRDRSSFISVAPLFHGMRNLWNYRLVIHGRRSCMGLLDDDWYFPSF